MTNERKETIYCPVSVKLTDAMRLEISSEVARHVVELSGIQEEKKSTVARYSAMEKDIKIKISDLSNSLVNGEIVKEVRCVRLFQYHTGMVSVWREDTGEIIESREMADKERQAELPNIRQEKPRLESDACVIERSFLGEAGQDIPEAPEQLNNHEVEIVDPGNSYPDLSVEGQDIDEVWAQLGITPEEPEDDDIDALDGVGVVIAPEEQQAPEPKPRKRVRRKKPATKQQRGEGITRDNNVDLSDYRAV